MYLGKNSGSNHAYVKLHVEKYSSSMDMILKSTSGDETCTYPAVNVIYTRGYQTFFLVSYGVYDSASDELTSFTACYTDRNGWYLLNDIFQIEEPVGTVTNAAFAQTYPAVIGQSGANGYAIEHFCARSTFADGNSNDGYYEYGKMDIIDYISTGTDVY